MSICPFNQIANSIKFNEPWTGLESNHECCDIIFRVTTAVANFFEMISLCLVEAGSWVKYHVLEILPQDIAQQLDKSRVYTNQIITEEMDFQQRTNIINALALLPDGQKEPILRFAIQSFTPEMNAEERINIINASANLFLRRPNVVWLLMKFFTLKMNAQEIINTIDALAAIPPNHEIFFYAIFVRASTKEMNAEERMNLIKDLATIPSGQIFVIFDFLVQASVEEINAEEITNIINAIANFDSDERDEIIRLAKLLMNVGQTAKEKIQITQEIAAIPRNERGNFVQQQVNVLQAARQNTPEGVDVHSRDGRVRAAIEMLRRDQGGISTAEMNRAVDEFKEYLNNQQMDPNHKKLAQDALLGPKGSNDDFGPLISDTNFSILGLALSGEEVIGRLWIFASNLTGPDETNAKIGMISALKNSYDHTQDRICNPGKTQSLAIAVLQGRLGGVNIELTQEMHPPTSHAINMFFNIEANRAIEELEPLLKAAERFCNENSLINRQDFLGGIREYARFLV